MKKSEFYLNKYPLEELLQCPPENEIQFIISKCDYNIEASQIARNMGLPEVNDADAVVFYRMGFEAAIKEIENKLIAIDNCEIMF